MFVKGVRLVDFDLENSATKVTFVAFFCLGRGRGDNAADSGNDKD
jgi:hypothetical protein